MLCTLRKVVFFLNNTNNPTQLRNLKNIFQIILVHWPPDHSDCSPPPLIEGLGGPLAEPVSTMFYSIHDTVLLTKCLLSLDYSVDIIFLLLFLSFDHYRFHILCFCEHTFNAVELNIKY